MPQQRAPRGRRRGAARARRRRERAPRHCDRSELALELALAAAAVQPRAPLHPALDDHRAHARDQQPERPQRAARRPTGRRPGRRAPRRRRARRATPRARPSTATGTRQRDRDQQPPTSTATAAPAARARSRPRRSAPAARTTATAASTLERLQQAVVESVQRVALRLAARPVTAARRSPRDPRSGGNGPHARVHARQRIAPRHHPQRRRPLPPGPGSRARAAPPRAPPRSRASDTAAAPRPAVALEHHEVHELKPRRLADSRARSSAPAASPFNENSSSTAVRPSGVVDRVVRPPPAPPTVRMTTSTAPRRAALAHLVAAHVALGQHPRLRSGRARRSAARAPSAPICPRASGA